LKSEHRDVEDLFKKFEQLGDGAHKSREATVGKIIEALSKHAAIEEEILYPEIRERVEKGGDDDDMVLEALEEHHVAKATLAEIERLPSEDERFKAKVTVLMESVRHHVEEEEDELFPKVRDMFSKSELDEMGARLKAARQSAPSRPHPMAPDEPPGNIIANTLTAPLDATVAVAGGAARAVRRAVR
jgi:hemerythrin superfamily protein